MPRAVMLALVALVAGASVADAQAIDVKIKVPGYSEADALEAIDLFRQACRPLGGEFWGDVTAIAVTIDKEYADHRLALGWDNTLSLELSYSDDPQYGPASASGTGVLAGHTLHYDLGGGKKPGFLASKRSSQYLCGLPFDANGNDVFVGVPQLKVLDR